MSDSNCTSNEYVTPDGLSFTKFCDINMPNLDMVQKTTDSFESCMDACSTNDPLCYGVSWTTTTGECWMKNATAPTSDFDSSNITHSALAETSQLKGNTTCPYSNQQWVSPSDGLTFQVFCNRDLSGNDYLPLNWNFIHHADTLDECMDMCADAHPLCSAVSWNPNMTTGYPNCFPKTTGDTSNLIADSGYVSHVAIPSIPTVDTSCVDNSVSKAQVTSNNNVTSYSISCGQNIANPTVASSHADSLDSCIGQCSDYQNSTTGPCYAVAFDNTMSDGYDNCYLKNATGFNTISGDNYTIATAKSYTTDKSNSGTSAGVIAGATVGAVVGVAVIAALLYLWFRKQKKDRSRENLNSTTTEVEEDVPAYTDDAAVHDNKPVPQEVVDKNTTHELHSDEPLFELNSGQEVHELQGWDHMDDPKTKTSNVDH